MQPMELSPLLLYPPGSRRREPIEGPRQGGQALVSLDGEEQAVEGGDLIVIHPQVDHGLRTESQATWICLG